MFLWGGIALTDTATRYGQSGPGIESRCGRDFSFPCPERPCCTPLCNGYQVSFPQVKRPVPGLDRPTPSTAEDK